MTLVIAAVFSISAQGQGFLNLNFESAYNLPENPPFPNGELVSATNGLPDWTAYAGDNALAEINYVSNDISGSQTSVELEGGALALSGDFSVGLYDGGNIRQMGLVPAGAESLKFEANAVLNFSVILGGQTLSYSALSEGPNYTVYGANILAGMDGQMEMLTFFNAGPGEGTVLDNIEFSTPEPAEWAIIGVGALLLGFWRRRKRERFG